MGPSLSSGRVDHKDEPNAVSFAISSQETMGSKPKRKKSKRSGGPNKKETGESSSQDQYLLCLICLDSKPELEMFKNMGCNHNNSFCNDCISKYIETKITQDNIPTVKCPVLNCDGVLEPHLCRSIVAHQVLDRWQIVICEALVPDEQKFYCPFKDCSALLVDGGEEFVTVSECPNCHRLFCAQCKVPWHNGLNCREFWKLGKDERDGEDLMFMELAKEKKWRGCPKCKIYVEKKYGCVHITCRYHFCYACGSKWAATHECSSPLDPLDYIILTIGITLITLMSLLLFSFFYKLWTRFFFFL